MFLSSGDRDLGVAFKVHLGSQASSRVEAKNSALLWSCDGYLLEPFEWPKGSQASYGVLRGNSGLLSRLCRKRRASSHDDDDGGMPWFSRVVAGSLAFLSLRRGTQGASRVVPGKSSQHSSCEGERGIALESWQGNRASFCVEGGVWRSFSSCGRKLWVPSSCDGDLRELLMVPMGSQESFRVVRGLSGFL